MTEWKPIESAPKYNGDYPPRVLLWVADGGRNEGGTYAFGVIWRECNGCGAVTRASAEGFLGNWKITHWAALEPPK